MQLGFAQPSIVCACSRIVATIQGIEDYPPVLRTVKTRNSRYGLEA
jgi:hypothetical protein